MNNTNVDVTIEYVNELKCKVIASKEILYSLRDEYSFFVDGYKFNPKYKSGMWDGKIYMLDNKGLIYTGLLKSLLKTCKSKGLTIKVNDIHKYMPSKIDESVIDNLLSYFKLTAFDYQLKSIKEALEKRKLLILSPTSSGKSFICAALYRYCIDNNIPLLITVPSTSLVEQLYSDFEEYMADDHIVSDHVAKLYSGQEKNPTHQVIISTWQSLMNKEPEWFSKFNFYICDEAHCAASVEVSKIIDNLSYCQYRIGLTGTLSGAEMHELEMQARFGDIFKMVSTRELIDRGIVTDIEIKMQQLKYESHVTDHFYKYSKDYNGKINYQKEVDFIINLDIRNKYIIDLANSLNTTTLMLFNKIEDHGKKLLEELNNVAVKNLKKVYYIAGSIKPKEREKIRKALDGELPIFYKLKYNNGFVLISEDVISDEILNNKIINLSKLNDNEYYIENNVDTNDKFIDYEKLEGSFILLATYGTLSTGVNIKNLHNLIFTQGYKSKIRNLQSIGRILRKSKVKNKVYLYDLVDDFRKGKKENYSYRHGVERMKIYEDEEFDYDIIPTEIK